MELVGNSCTVSGHQSEFSIFRSALETSIENLQNCARLRFQTLIVQELLAFNYELLLVFSRKLGEKLIFVAIFS
jgi:hypothetical protein